MRLSAAALFAAAPVLAFHAGTSFIPQSALKRLASDQSNTFHGSSSVTRPAQNAAEHSSSALGMAFKLKEGQKSNMFDGPMSLVQERDACGVGFICNAKSGGEPEACVIPEDPMMIP